MNENTTTSEIDILRKLTSEQLGRLFSDATNCEEIIEPEELGEIMREGNLDCLDNDKLGQLVAYGASEEIIPNQILGDLLKVAVQGATLTI
tara:strand:+ start:321 stop:593 length:273 start_codon:yes stop_codon:yes gene_type:complete